MQTAEILDNGCKPEVQESPEYLRMSLAAAMTLGFERGLFHRGARLHCINLLLNYQSGCAARCSYCGLSGKRPGQYETKSFIRVTWPNLRTDDIVERIAERLDRVKRICISQITNKRSLRDSVELCTRFRAAFDVPISVLVAPTIVGRDHLLALKEAGADKIGVAIDLATPELFAAHRGKGVGGPHHWDRYVECLTEAIEIFGERNAGSHLVTGMGETEQEMLSAIQRIQDMGGWTHLFSFFPEAESQLADHPMPPMAQYRNIQLGRWIIDEKLARYEDMEFDEQGVVTDFGLPRPVVDGIIDNGEPFRTSGCAGYDGEVACNRPYANERPGPNIRNFPFKPELSDIARIREQMNLPQTALTQGHLPVDEDEDDAEG